MKIPIVVSKKPRWSLAVDHPPRSRRAVIALYVCYLAFWTLGAIAISKESLANWRDCPKSFTDEVINTSSPPISSLECACIPGHGYRFNSASQMEFSKRELFLKAQCCFLSSFLLRCKVGVYRDSFVLVQTTFFLIPKAFISLGVPAFRLRFTLPRVQGHGIFFRRADV